MASLEGGVGALATGSGQAAQFLAISSLLDSGDHMVSSSTALWRNLTPSSIVSFRSVPGFDTDVRGSRRSGKFPQGDHRLQTRLLYAGNDQQSAHERYLISKQWRRSRTRPAYRSCWTILLRRHTCAARWSMAATSWSTRRRSSLCRPAAQPCISVIVDSGKFPWNNGHYPHITEPAAHYHGMKFHETFGGLAYIIKCRVDGMRDFGASMSPFNSFLFLQGLETLPLRMEAHSKNALAVSKFLESHKFVTWVNYPGLRLEAPIARWQGSMCRKDRYAILAFGNQRRDGRGTPLH